MPTRTEIIEAGARAIAGEYDRRIKLKSGSWWSGKHRRHALHKEAGAALTAMLPFIKAQLAAEVRGNHIKDPWPQEQDAYEYEEWFDAGTEYAARIIENFEL